MEPPKPPMSKFIKEKYWMFNRFVKVLRIVECGPMRTKAAQEPICIKTKISNRFVKIVRIMEYGPIARQSRPGAN